MNKRLLTLWVVWLLAWTPKVYAEIDSLKMGTKKDLVEVVSTNKQEEEKLTATFYIEEVKKTSEEKEVLEKVLLKTWILDDIWKESLWLFEVLWGF